MTQKERETNKNTQNKTQEREFSLEDFHIDTKYRTHMIKEINESLLGQTIKIGGWIESIRNHGDLIFIDLREDGEIFQIKISQDIFGDLKAIE